jgi:hypothetical protein
MADHLPVDIRATINKLKKSADESQLQMLDKLDRQLGAMVPADRGDGVMRVESMVNSTDKNPAVSFIWGSNKGVLDPITARGYAMQIIEACEAAIQDAALYRAITSNGGTDQDAFGMINLVRDHRRKFEEE